MQTPSPMNSPLVRFVAIVVIMIALFAAFSVVKNFDALWRSAQESANVNKSAGLNEYTGQESTAMVGMWPIIVLLVLVVVVCIAGYLVWNPQGLKKDAM